MVLNTIQVELLKSQIEQMNKFNHIEILRILKNNKIPINENKNGVFINLTEIDTNIIQQLQQYVEYVNTQQKQLHNIEQQKEDYENKFFNNLDSKSNQNVANKDIKDIKDKETNNIINA